MPGQDTGTDVRLRVEDTGIGMTPEVRARMFEPFYTTRPDVPGIGLATVQAVVSQHRGRLEVESAPSRVRPSPSSFPRSPRRCAVRT